MKLIPVIDIRNSQVVTAIAGKRHAYTPSDTPLCHSSQPPDVLSALLHLHPFDTLYVADLDAIERNGSNLELIRSLHNEHPELTLWVDNGLSEPERLCEFARPVIGSESLTSCDSLCQFLNTLDSPLLSLDYLADRFKGPAGLDQQPSLWPEEVIVMTLSRVGSVAGPDTVRLQRLLEKSPLHHFIAAGGVRHRSDLLQLEAIGVTAVLLSTALHQGCIDRATLHYFADA